MKGLRLAAQGFGEGRVVMKRQPGCDRSKAWSDDVDALRRPDEQKPFQRALRHACLHQEQEPLGREIFDYRAVVKPHPPVRGVAEEWPLEQRLAFVFRPGREYFRGVEGGIGTVIFARTEAVTKCQSLGEQNGQCEITSAFPGLGGGKGCRLRPVIARLQFHRYIGFNLVAVGANFPMILPVLTKLDQVLWPAREIHRVPLVQISEEALNVFKADCEGEFEDGGLI